MNKTRCVSKHFVKGYIDGANFNLPCLAELDDIAFEKADEYCKCKEGEMCFASDYAHGFIDGQLFKQRRDKYDSDERV